MAKILRALREPRLLVVLLMGFSSGLPLLLIGSTMKGWMTELKIDLTTIGLFAFVTLPYTCKFVWSPLMDRYVPFGYRRRGWLLITQLGLVASIVALSLIDPLTQLAAFAAAAFVVAFFSASQDIVVDAYRREILPDEELGFGSSLYVLGYRLALFATGAGAFIIADHLTWSQTYWVMAGMVGVGLLTTIFCAEPKLDVPPPKTLRESVVGPLSEFFKREGAWLILAFIVLYKVGESMGSDMTNPFFIQIGFTKTQIGAVAKVFGIWATIAGGLVGGILLIRTGIYRGLWIFGILQSLGLLLFSWLAVVGPDVRMLAVAIGTESFTSGMATTAFVAFMASQTNRRFTATQYALMTSLMGVPRVFFGATTGWLAQNLGWELYFVTCMILTIPGLLLLFKVKRLIDA